MTRRFRPNVSLMLLATIFVEIAVFILVGRAIGVLPTLGLVLASMLAGAGLLRRQGVAALSRLRADAAAGRSPAPALLDGAAITAAALLMLAPGLLTSAVGAMLFVPAVRRGLGALLLHRLAKFASADPRRPGFGPAVVELDRQEYVAWSGPSASPWRRDSNRD